MIELYEFAASGNCHKVRLLLSLFKHPLIKWISGLSPRFTCSHGNHRNMIDSHLPDSSGSATFCISMEYRPYLSALLCTSCPSATLCVGEKRAHDLFKDSKLTLSFSQCSVVGESKLQPRALRL